MKRTFSIFGDSISTFEGCVPEENHVYYQGEKLEETGVARVEDTWWSQVVERLGGTVLANGSFSGSMVEGAGFPAAWSPERIAQIAGPCGEAPDDVLVFIGINDYGWGGARAQAAGRSAAMPRCAEAVAVPEAVAGIAPLGALEKFEDAYRLMLGAMRAAYPDAKIHCMTLLPGRDRLLARPSFCYRLRGIDFDDYNAAIRRAASETGCQVADIRSFGFDYEASDGTHPTRLGMRQLADMVVAALECEGDVGAAVFAANRDVLPDGMRSERLCDKPACVGCSHARATGNQWSCACER